MKTTTEITIRNYHIDHFGHVNHARYVELLEEARWRYLEENKLDSSKLSIHRVIITIKYRFLCNFGWKLSVIERNRRRTHPDDSCDSIHSR